METITFDQLPGILGEIKEQLNRIEDRLLVLSPPEDKEELLTIAEASKLINLAESTIYGKVCKKAIPVHKKGKKLYFEKRALLDWVKQGRKSTVQQAFQKADEYISRGKRR